MYGTLSAVPVMESSSESFADLHSLGVFCEVAGAKLNPIETDFDE